MVPKETVERALKEIRDEMLQNLKELVELESPSDRKEAVHRAAEKVVEQFSPYYSKSKVLGEEGKVYVVNPDAEVLFIGHIDTVHPIGTLEKNPFRIVNNKIYGPGVLDMKAGFVVLLGALKILERIGKNPPAISLLINTEEEIGSPRTLTSMKKAARKAKMCLSLEPSGEGGKLKTRRKGVAALKLEAWGREAHAGLAPEKGINAIEEVIYQAKRIKEWANQQGFSFNLGVIRGGSRANVVPGYCEALIDIRHDEDKFASIFKEYEELLEPRIPGARVALSVQSFVPPLNPSEKSRMLYSKLKEIGSELGMEIDEIYSGGGSDASWFSHWGVATVDGLGPEGRGEHSPEEHLFLDSFMERIIFITFVLLHIQELLRIGEGS